MSGEEAFSNLKYKFSTTLPIGTQLRDLTARTREMVRQDVIAYATIQNALIMESPPRPNGEIVTVDGVVGASIDSVQFGGEIDFKYLRFDDISQFALETLRSLSPVGSGKDPHAGQYRDAHALYLNGTAVSDLSAYRPGDDAYILNPLPYARKIEQGTMTMHVPGTDHVYQQAEQIVNARMGNSGKVAFEYRDNPNGGGGPDDRVPALTIAEG